MTMTNKLLPILSMLLSFYSITIYIIVIITYNINVYTRYQILALNTMLAIKIPL